MSGDVAAALGLLGLNVRRVGDKGQPPRGTGDGQVAAAARKQGRYIFTNNFDMIVSAVNEKASFIWFFDRKDNSPSKYNQGLLFMLRWNSWEDTLAQSDVECLRVSMGRSTPITLEGAKSQAQEQMERREKNRARQAAYRDAPRLNFDDDD